MGRSFRRLLLLTCMIGLLFQSSQALATRSLTCGAYSDRLCEGQSLNASQYLESANGDFKFYYQSDGRAVIYDATTNPITAVKTVFQPPVYGQPQELTYSDPWVNNTFGSTYGDVHITLWSTTGGEDYLDGLYYASGASPDGDHFLVLDNNGYLKSIDDNGTLKVWGGPN